MSYHLKIKNLEESYKQTLKQIETFKNSDDLDKEKYMQLCELKEKYFDQLALYRKKQYELDQEVDFGDER